MLVHEPITHWSNFSVSELKEILKHCRALENLGIAQDEEFIADIERDIRMREQKIVSGPKKVFSPDRLIATTKTRNQKKYLLEQNVSC